MKEDGNGMQSARKRISSLYIKVSRFGCVIGGNRMGGMNEHMEGWRRHLARDKHRLFLRLFTLEPVRFVSFR